MPVQLRSIHGKVDYDVEIVLRDLTAAVNQLEQRVTPAAAPDQIAAVSDIVRQVARRVDDLNRRVLALENP